MTDDDVYENQGKSGRERKLFPVTSLIKIMTSNHHIARMHYHNVFKMLFMVVQLNKRALYRMIQAQQHW